MAGGFYPPLSFPPIISILKLFVRGFGQQPVNI